VSEERGMRHGRGTAGLDAGEHGVFVGEAGQLFLDHGDGLPSRWW